MTAPPAAPPARGAARPRPLSAREERVRAALEAVRARCDAEAARRRDPVGFVHRYRHADDREIVGLVAACVAFGNVKAVRQKLEDALGRLGPRPGRLADDAEAVGRALDGWVHRVYRGEDLTRLIVGARRVQRAHGSLGARFVRDLEATSAVREALARLCDAIRAEGGFPLGGAVAGARRGPAHLLPDVRGSSGSKRMLLYLRWMARPGDGIDLGLWPVPASQLLCPVDVHIHKLARNLGLARRAQLSWKTTEEITSHLLRFDPHDPVKYDFSLCHMGMLQRCPSRRDPRRCEGCGVQPVCRHWERAR